MWVKTCDGDFVNLDHVHSVYTEDDPDELADADTFEIIAEHDNEDYTAVLYRSKDKEKIKSWMDKFERTLKEYNLTILDITSEVE